MSFNESDFRTKNEKVYHLFQLGKDFGHTRDYSEHIASVIDEEISSIIDNAKWVRDSAKHLILQPMSAVDDLRIYLAENGFSVEKEVLVKDSSRIYIVISAYYSGKKLDFPPEYAYVGNVSASDYLGKEYLEKEYNRIKKHADMLLNSNKPNAREGLLLIAKAIKERLCSDD